MKKILYCVMMCTLAPSFLQAMSREAIILKHLSDNSRVKQHILTGEVKSFLPIINLFWIVLYYSDSEKDLEDKIEKGTATKAEQKQYFWQVERRTLAYKHTQWGNIDGGRIVQGECKEAMEKFGFDAKKRMKETILIQTALCETGKNKNLIIEKLKELKGKK